MNHLISDLDQKFIEIAAEDNHRDFLIKIIDYSRYLEGEPITAALLSDLVEASKNDIAEYLSEEASFLRKFKPLVRDLLNIANDLNVRDQTDHPLMENNIARLEEFMKERRVDYYFGDLEGIYHNYINLLQEIFKLPEGQERLAMKHIRKDGHVIIADEYGVVEKIWNLYKELRKSQTWWAHYEIQRLHYGVTRRKEDNPYFHNDEIVDQLYQYEFDRVATGGVAGSYSVINLERKKFKVWIDRLHNYIMSRLRDKAEESFVDDTATHEGLAIKWETLQVIRRFYVSSSRADSILVPVVDMQTSKKRDLEIIDNVLKGIQSDGIFKGFTRKGRYYNIEHINHDQFEDYNIKVQEENKQRSDLYKSRVQKENNNADVSKGAVELPQGWRLEEKGQMATLMKGATAILKFNNTGADQYLYFKTIITSYPEPVIYKKLYEDVKQSKYPPPGKQTRVNQNIRTSINKLRKKINLELNSNRLDESTFEIITAKGFRLQISPSP